ncbi:uncharacterized protein TrAFT101_006945 [Trichoderma asperellum]|uniref:uncharacterized protein n=1 Tax=Trichoderma asperellum TaxID=101201 RepID=UPI0033326666|nr:hypothetical protein TrAFT101_006945 [Trichoderma asperellum]
MAGVRQSRRDGYAALEAAVFGSTQCQKWKPEGSGVPRPRGGSAPDSVLWLHHHGTDEILLLYQSAAYTPAKSLDRQSIRCRGGSHAAFLAVFSKTQYPDIRGSACSHARKPSTVLGARRRRIQSELSLQQTALAAGSKGV